MSDDENNNPLLAVDTIIIHNRKIVLVERKNPPKGWALPGGFVDVGETLEAAARRETREETNLTLENLRQWRTYSQPDRDPRQHVVSQVFTGRGSGRLSADSDARNADVFSLHSDLPNLVFDHRAIVEDYRDSRFKPTCHGAK